MSATAQATLSLNANGFEAALQNASAKLDKFGDTLREAIGGELGKIAGLAAGVFAVDAAFDQLSETAKEGLQLNANLEQTRTALATLLGQFKGSAVGDFANRTRIAAGILDDLREKGLYAEATFAQLTDTLQMTAGNFFSAGIDGANQQIDAIVAVSQALAAYGGDQANLTSEVNALLTGQVRPWDKVAKGAGITSEAIKKAQQEGKLFAFIMEKLRPITNDAAQGMDNFGSQLTINKELFEDFKTELMAPAFEVLKQGLKSLNEALKAEEIKQAISDISYQIALGAKAAAGFLAQLVKWLPTILNIAGVLSKVVVPALAAFSLRMIMASTLAVKMGAVIRQVFQSISLVATTSFANMSSTANVAFANMAKSGQLAALGINAALMVAMAGFMLVMSKVAEMEQATDRLKEAGEELTATYRELLGLRGIVIDERGNPKKTGEGGPTTRMQVNERVSQVNEDIDKARREANAFAEKSYKPEDRVREAGDFEPDATGNVGYTKRFDRSETDQATLDAMNAKVAMMERERDKLAQVTDAELLHNAAVAAGIDAEKKRQEAIASLPQAIDAKRKKLAEDTKEAAFSALTPEEQKTSVLSGTGHTSEAGLDKTIRGYEADQSTLDAEQLQYLDEMYAAKLKLVSINATIAKQAADQADKAKKEADKRAEIGKELKAELAIKAAKAAGDEDEAQRLEDNLKRKQLADNFKGQGFTDAEASRMAAQSVQADQNIRQADKNRQQEAAYKDFNFEFRKAIAKATGNTAESDAIDREQRRQGLVDKAKAAGYSGSDAETKANQMLAAEEASDLQSKIDSAVKNSSPVFASSMRSIGGGGVSVGGGADVLSETRRHTQLLQQIRDAVRNNRSTAKPSSSTSTWENI